MTTQPISRLPRAFASADEFLQADQPAQTEADRAEADTERLADEAMAEEIRKTRERRVDERGLMRAQAIDAVQQARVVEGRGAAPWTAHDADTAYAVADLLLMAAGRGDGVRASAQAVRSAVSGRRVDPAVEAGIAAAATEPST